MRNITCSFLSTSTSYEIEIDNSFFYLYRFLNSLKSTFVIITDETVAKLYGNELYHLLLDKGLRVFLFTFPAGEESKNGKIKEFLENQMFAQGLGKDTCVIALGGGVVTDLAGFIASTYCRGISFIVVPTTLLGMVDASIGGKNGINVSYGKNLLGTIYQPKKVIINISTLKTLPKNELRNGITEMIKHGLIADKNYYDYLEKESQNLLELNSSSIKTAIFESCRIKKEIVEQDENENGKRRLLNFGHTIGHAIEKLSNYKISHGEAVAIGIVIESHISMQLKQLPENSFNRILKIFETYDLPLKLPQFSVDEILSAMTLDKKSLDGKPRFVLLKEIGECLSFNLNYCTHIDEELIKKALHFLERLF